MTEQSISARMENAVQASSPTNALADLASALKAEGMSQFEMYRLFDEYRAKHQSDADETRCDAILDTMDVIVGWCSPTARLFDSELRM